MIAVEGLFSSPHTFYLPHHDRDDNALPRFIASVSRDSIYRVRFLMHFLHQARHQSRFCLFCMSIGQWYGLDVKISRWIGGR